MPSPGATLPHRYICLDGSDTQTQVLGWGTHCWLCTSDRVAPAASIANTRPGVEASALLERWRHLIR